MTTTLPTIASTGYALSTSDFRKTKIDRSGAVRLLDGSITVPASTASATVIGLVPFNSGAKLASLQVYSGDLDTSTNITMSVGYTYYDSTLGTSSATAWVSGSTAPQTGGFLTGTGTGMMNWTAATDGWITVTTGGGATTTSGTIYYKVGLAYDESGVTNAG